MKYLYFIIFLINCIFLCKVLSTSEFTYKAAVVEYSPDFDHGDGPNTRFKRSVADYQKYIEKASAEKVDIIIFPEDGMTGLGVPANRDKLWGYATKIPDPANQISPCDTSTKFASHLKSISCAAATNKIYVAVNLVEVCECKGETKCREDGVFYYNTNVVFDRNGVVIARYRKYNLFVEPGFDITEKPDLTIFETDFNVTFGMFICFDILFQTPAVKLVKDKNVHDIIYSTAWFSELPFLTAVQTQLGWAYGNDVTVLAAGYNNPKNKNGGSGIYIGKAGALTHIFPLSRENSMLVAEVPKYPFYDKFNTLKDSIVPVDNYKLPDDVIFYQDDLTKYTTEIIKDMDFDKKICNGELCCQFEINSMQTNDSPYIYRAVVFDGIRSYARIVNAGTQVCSVINCLNDKLETCGMRNRTLETGVMFENIKIRGNFKQNENTLDWPTTLATNILPYPSLYFQYAIADDRLSIEMTLLEKTDDLLTFGIYGRDFARDSKVHLNVDELQSILVDSGIKSNANSPFFIMATLLYSPLLLILYIF